MTQTVELKDKQLINNYRPISLIPICGKLFEKIVFDNVYSYLNVNNLITKNQSGFRPGDSATNQLLFLVNEIHESFEDKKSLEVRAVFLDISKAFDKVWHQGLLFKLKQNGIHGPLLSFFESYLSNRQQRVVLNGFYSDYEKIESGVPQGSVLGPLLFLIYINDLEENVKSNVKFFADDTMLYSIVNDPHTSASELNHDLEVIRQWAYQWKMEFNPDITKQATEMIFSCKRKKPPHPPLYFNGSIVANVTQQKHLGLTILPNLSFKKHLYEKLIKAKKIIGSLKHLSTYMPIKSLELMYKAFVRPHLDYCDIIYHEPAKINPTGQSLTTSMEDVERIQYRAALMVTGAWKGSNRSRLYEELGWESLSDRRYSRRMLQLHKIENNRTPRLLRDKLPTHSTPTTFQSLLRYNSTDRYKKSFFPEAIKNWNIMIPFFDTMPTFLELKANMIALFRPKKKSIFDIYDPIGLSYIFQLRLGLSPLRSHKKRHNFEDTPTDRCECGNDIENAHHFLFKCPYFAICRASLAVAVVEILIPNGLNRLADTESLYLYGHHSLSDAENRSIITSTIRYIKETNRFS